MKPFSGTLIPTNFDSMRFIHGRVGHTLSSWEGLREFAEFNRLRLVIKHMQNDQLLAFLQQKLTGSRL